MTWGKPEAVRNLFKDEIVCVEAGLVTLTALTSEGQNPLCVIRREKDPKRNWTTRIASWCMISPIKGQGGNYMFALQWVRDVPGGPRVKAGCKYKTLPQAWQYIKGHGRGYNHNKYAQAECIIRLLLLKAQDAGLPGAKGLKFDGSLSKR